jgi:hypothetical protein
MRPEPEACAMCGEQPAPAPRIHVRQERLLDQERRHIIALCAAHAAELQRGRLAPHEVIFRWASAHFERLYEGVRLALRPELRCLNCNEPLLPPAPAAEPVPTPAATPAPAEVECGSCRAGNILGTALGHEAAVQLRLDFDPPDTK